MRKNSIKNTRVNAEVQKELAELIRGGIKDPRIHPMTSVTGVEVAPDLKTCKAYISVLGDEEAKKNTKTPTIIEFIIDPEEMVYPMIKPGGTLEDMIMDC